MAKCGCKLGFDCPEATRLFERVKELYEDARLADFAEKLYFRYNEAQKQYREHRHEALGRKTFKDIIAK